jgi:hypothetical protein
MPSTARSLVLFGLLLVGCVAMRFSADRLLSPARWPSDEGVFQADGWRVAPAAVDTIQTSEETEAIIQRAYRRVDANQTGNLVVWTHPQPQAKTQFRKGPDRDLLGDGYLIEPAPPGLVPPIEGGGAFIARRGSEAWLGLYTFGERRGRLGAGPLGWGLAELDAVLDAPNDYFLARLLFPLDLDPTALRSASELADMLFASLGAWYQG